MAYKSRKTFFTAKEELIISIAKSKMYILRNEIDMIYIGKQNADKAIQRLLFFRVLLEDKNPNVFYYNDDFGQKDQTVLFLDGEVECKS